MKIVAISDTHGSDFVNRVPDCDLLLIAGDISPVNLDHTFMAQKYWFHKTFIDQLTRLRNRISNIAFIGGNHDTYLYEIYTSQINNTIQHALPPNVHYLCNDLIDINGITIFGSPWCVLPSWGRPGPPVWNFAQKDLSLINTYKTLPDKIDILLSHGPAYGHSDAILDHNLKFVNIKPSNQIEHLGSTALADRIKQIDVKYVLTGHIHSAQREYTELNGARCSCVSILDEQYRFNEANPPLVIELYN